MKILHIAPIKIIRSSQVHSREAKIQPEGISFSVPSLASAQIRNGDQVGIISSFTSDKPEDESIYWMSLASQNILQIISGKTVSRIIKDFGYPDILNVHDIYNLKQIILSIYFMLRGVKVFVSPRGTFSKVALSRSSTKKKIFLFFYKIYALFIDSFVALNKGELRQIKEIFPKKNIVILGNGLDSNIDRVRKYEDLRSQRQSTELNIGFLGRFDVYIKGLDLLIEAYTKYQIETEDIKINLILLGEHRTREYNSKEYLNDAKFRLKNSSRLLIKGPFYGEDKWEELYGLDILIQPSRTEGMPNTVLEAMSIGLPCAVTHQTNVADIIQNARAGWSMNASVDEIFNFLIEVNGIDKKELESYSINAQKYAMENLTWDKIAQNRYS